LTSRITFRVATDTTYRIAVDGYAFDPDHPVDEGIVHLTLSFSTASPSKPAPDWVLPDINGQIVSSTNFAGKVVLLSFWATWCEPCIAEIPDLVALHNQYASAGFTVVGVSVDDAVGGASPTALVKSFAESYQMDYPVVMSRPGSSVEFDYGGIAATPTTFIIDRHNNIVAQTVGSNAKSYYEGLIKPLLYADILMTAQSSPNGVRIAWAASPGIFVLEATEHLDSPVWQTVNTPAQLEGTNLVVTITTDRPARFYRLRVQ
jgi:thiol-disulfide isomerase/thioredoxin